MSSERNILCGDADWPTQQLPGLKDPVPLQLWGTNQNVSLKIQDISKNFAANISDIFSDLIEIAAYVYCADQAVTRGGKTDRGMGTNWRRHLRFHIPVRQPDVWLSSEISKCLSSTLGFLSDDHYTFNFTKLANPPSFERYLEGVGDPGLKPEEIVLFSGGLDSLSGAIQEAVIEKKQTILVSHRSSPKILTKQRYLFKELVSHCTGPAPLHVPVWVTKKGNWGKEYTQRTRSFLFVALGATVAHLFGLTRIRMYENGVVSLNLPISAQIIGARATRTTHPRVIKGFSELFSMLMGKPFNVENPFIWETKADIVSQIADAGCADLIKDTVSCAHVMEMTDLHTHCGKCSQCVDRRFATLASGNGNFDPEEMYKVDLLKGARELGEDRTMLESYVRTATLVNKMTEMEFFPHFGETTRIISHLDGTSSENAEKILDLHRRHAKQICGVVDKAIGEHAKEIREEILPASCLLILALPEGYRKSAELPAAKQRKAGNLFRREGDSWIVGYDDVEVFLKDARGLRYIAFLLRYPKQEFHVLRLIQEVVGTASVETGEIVDGMGREQLAQEGLSISSSEKLMRSLTPKPYPVISDKSRILKRICKKLKIMAILPERRHLESKKNYWKKKLLNHRA